MSTNIKSNVVRNGIKDLWNAELVQNAKWTSSENPQVKTTATSLPKQIISYKKAKRLYKDNCRANPKFKSDAFIHFYIDDDRFDSKIAGIWANPNKFFKIASHFAGIIGPDFSIYADFPDPLKRFQVYKMRAFEFACSRHNIPVIINARWRPPSTWKYTIDELPTNSMLAIGSVASRLKYLENRYAFEAGFSHLLKEKSPHTLIVVGSASYSCFEKAKKQGVQILQFDGDTAHYYKQKQEVNYVKTR